MLRYSLAVLLTLPLLLVTVVAFAHPPTEVRATKILDPAHLPQCQQQGPIIIPACPTGTHLVIWDAPDYDDSGLFVVCLKKEPVCIQDGLGPEG